MGCYSSLAQWYDQFTGDVPYGQFADLYEAEFSRCGGEFRLLLDLCCGTGTLTWEMSRRGYELIGVDASVDMLMQARDKTVDVETPPLFLCQQAQELDLYGTVDCAYCSLDGINYIKPQLLPEVFHRLSLFIRPGGLFIFDIRTPQWLASLDGQISLDETEEALCIWRSDYDEAAGSIIYGMDIFSCQGELWSRSSEEHVEYVHLPETLKALLESESFVDVEFISSCPQGEYGRLFIRCQRSN